MMGTYRTHVALSALLLIALVLPQQSAAQDLQYTSTTKLELEGAAGRAVNFVSRLTGQSNETTETVYLRGNRMRTDDEGSSTILDLDQQRFIMLNHEAKTYAVMPFSQMAEMAEHMAERAEEAIEEARSEMSDEDAAAMQRSAEEDVQIEYDLKVERTGEVRDIRGHRAERVLMIMSARGKQQNPEDGQEPAEGALVLANEMWLTTDRSGELEPLFDFQERMGQGMQESFGDMAASGQSMGDAFGAAFASDPRMGEMMKGAAEEMSKMDGVPLISVMKMVAVPGKMEFDVALAFGEKEEKEQVSASQRAGRAARSFMRGRFGRGNDAAEVEEEQEPELKQSTLLSITTEISDVQHAALSDDLFAAPADYEERTLMTLHE